jgi:quinohemoprotein amine dehydrogenase
MTRRLMFGLGAVALLVTTVRAATPPPQAETAQSSTTAPKPDPDDGFPIQNDTVISACGSCHTLDDKSRMSRISFRRTTPEGWQETVRRMATLNGAQIDPAAAREVVKYLSDRQGLAPDEVAPAAFEVERRLIDFKYTANADTERTCAACHSMGRVMLQRRSAQEWDLVVAMHRGWYPLVDFQTFRRGGPPSTQPGPDGRPPDNRHPFEKAVAHLRGAFPLRTPEWAEWSATMRSPRLAGTWAIGGYEPGAGPFYGTMTVTASPASPDEFTTEATFTYARSGRVVTRSGRVMIYTGFQWRGRSMVGGNEETSLREVMHLDRGWSTAKGRWFTGGYDELGMDVTLTRVAAGPVVAGFDRPAVARAAQATPLRIYGANLPGSPAPADIDFGPGVTVTRVVSASPTAMAVEVRVAADAALGSRDLILAGTLAPKAIAIYDRVDFVKVTPAWSMARVGGVVFPKMFSQFEVTGYAHGPDGKPETNDDVVVGPVDARWTIEEYPATLGDDDIRFVGEIDASTGRFTPALDGPNPQRSGNRNNVGDVWVVGTHTTADGRTLRARAHLIVTVPLYMRWDFFTMGGTSR